MKKNFLNNDKHVFWEALIIAVFVFGLGILFGVFIENSRVDIISEMFLTSEINLLDVQIQTAILDSGDVNCEEAVKKNIEFADDVFADAKQLNRYEETSRLSDSLLQQHKRYDLLRTLLWLNSLKIKEKCGENSFHTVVYLYDFEPEDIELINKQVVFERFLNDLKEKFGNDIILIPIAKNLELSSLDLLVTEYSIHETSIIVDEDLVVTELEELDKVNEFIKKSGK